MIRLSVATGGGQHRTEYIAPGNVARITEAGASSQWHGIRSIVRLFDGSVLECEETAGEVCKRVEQALAASEPRNGEKP